ncbi:MAG: branched-chain amino acid ABC transporter permease [Rhodomicrobium sp.]
MSRTVVIAVSVAGITILLALLPLVSGNYLLRLATIGFMYVTLASSWNIVGGFLGYPSFASAAFFGLGAYGAAILRADFSLPLPIAWLAGGLTAGLFGLLIGPAILRLRGHYFAVASVVLASVLRESVNSATDLTGGGMGLTLPAVHGFNVNGQAELYYFSMFAAAALTLAGSAFLIRSRLGVAMRCIQQNEDAAMVLGINTLSTKIAALGPSALTAGLAGAIYATWIGYIDPTDVFDDLLSIKPIVMAFLGGVGTVAGPAIGAAIFLLLEEFVWRNALNFHAGILGLLIVVLLVFLPGGLGSIGRALTALKGYARSEPPRRSIPASRS